MKIDYALEQAEGYFLKHIPFLIYKPNFNSLDQTVPYISTRNKVKLIKVAMHDLGKVVNSDSAFYFIKQVLNFPIDEDTIIWVEDISPIDDKQSFVAHVIEEASKNEHIRLIFTGIDRECEKQEIKLPIVYWDADYGLYEYEHLYVQPSKCHSQFVAPQALHFRVYMNIIYEVIRELNKVPDAQLEVEGNRGGILSSILQVSLLAIQKGQHVRLASNERFATHKILTDAIMRGWSKPVKTVFEGDLNDKNSGISTVG